MKTNYKDLARQLSQLPENEKLTAFISSRVEEQLPIYTVVITDTATGQTIVRQIPDATGNKSVTANV